MNKALILAIVLLGLAGCGGASVPPTLDPVSARFTETAIEDLFRTAQAATSIAFLVPTQTAAANSNMMRRTAIAQSISSTRTAYAVSLAPVQTAAGEVLISLGLTNSVVIQNVDWRPIEHDFDGITMVLVPSGCFLMGTNNFRDAQPVHEICFDKPFWLDKYEVTQERFHGHGGKKAEANIFHGDRLPAENINWFEANEYCRMVGSRLPTEAEWEYAARGPDSLIFPWGNEEFDENAVFRGNSNDRTATAGSKAEDISWVGAVDLAGNVTEWTSSEYSAFPYDYFDGREEPSKVNMDVRRVLRGSAWNSISVDILFRNEIFADNESSSLGFRCARY